MVQAKRIIRILRHAVWYGFLLLIAIICIYAILNSLTLFLWGDPSVHGEPRMFHPPEIMVLHYVGMISPELARVVVSVLFGGLGFFLWFRFRGISRKTLLDHPLRERIAEFIQSHPGCHFSSLARELGINRGTLFYHLGQLTFFNIVQETKEGGLTRYYMHKAGITELEQKIMAHRDNPLRSQILSMLEMGDATPRMELKKNLDISGPALWYHMQMLVQDGIVLAEQDREKTGRPVQYSLTGDAGTIIRNGNGEIPALAGFPADPVHGLGSGSQPGKDSGIHE
ncbi:MAG: hypothetical protein M0R30_12065 [Methanoregula sp.]|uniref:winged helix-turn-helix transcriptional regulator n=1 Tax=Methanoregula sp. TaxID=2052170 RepID=UPI0025FF9F09|nr:hypothetical protein [Methanoregula sp.]MCK9632358.1 hypothetical protein [Methanoregula sp.]